MFRLTACARVRANRFAAKDCRTVSVVTVSNSRSPEVVPPVAVSILMNDFKGEFMRSIIATAAACAIIAGHSAFAQDGTRLRDDKQELFAEDGIYVPAGKTVEVTIAGHCHRFTNEDEHIGFYFSPSRAESWPGKTARGPQEPIVTEEPCK